jgi:hypothetical protein
MIAAAKRGCTLFKNVRGFFLTLDGARKVRAGLAVNGSSDLIGFTRVKITPDMVGKTVAVFTAVEVKTAKGAVSDDQRAFIATVIKNGGYSGVARCEKDFILLVDSPASSAV